MDFSSIFCRKNQCQFHSHLDENDDENKTAADDLSAVGNLLKTDELKGKHSLSHPSLVNTLILIEIESSSDEDELDDSDDPDKETIEAIAVIEINIPSLFPRSDDLHLGPRQYSTNSF